MSKNAVTRRKARQRKEKNGFYGRNEGSTHKAIWEHKYGTVPAGFHLHRVNRSHKDNRLENLVALPDWYSVQIYNDILKDPGLEHKYNLEYLLARYFEFLPIYVEHNKRLAEVNAQLSAEIIKFRREAMYPKGRCIRKKSEPAKTVVIVAKAMVARVATEPPKRKTEVFISTEDQDLFSEFNASIKAVVDWGQNRLKT